ncbi:MBL fold metallo-hydrolase [Silvanigrella aquatica]|uniref:MBL fold metallo-hydrolase n=1 Tax=Silvanigrella aquatica TaxID=1915309 RepID=A0A1L4D0H8_9BACT|nr:MBL fold metallo-hydrolase [Silvanigrella aquatica]APJ03705.1 MBL fold metallo-hydrolase [Silvanigrella aquatica]
MKKWKHVFGITATVFSVFTSAIASGAQLNIEVYNPGTKSLFPVSSEIISGKKEVVLIDAQIQTNDAQALVEKIKKTEKKLTLVFISHKDPDFYFGLETIRNAFPDVKILATPETVKAIKESMDSKLAYWSPILKENAPKKVILPDVLDSDSFMVDDQKIEIKGLKTNPSDTYLWIPSLKTALGGVIVYNNMHVWVADNQTPESRAKWFESIESIKNLNPIRVIPGHFLGSSNFGLKSLEFTEKYLKNFEMEAAKAKNSKELISAMQKRYSKLTNKDDLELSAKVIKGEMKWPQ